MEIYRRPLVALVARSVAGLVALTCIIYDKLYENIIHGSIFYDKLFESYRPYFTNIYTLSVKDLSGGV